MGVTLEKTEIFKIDPSEYGLEENKAKQISDMFKPMLDKMVKLETQYNEVVLLPMSEETSETAKELRFQYVKIRTGTAVIHKELKRFYLQGGRFVDGWKNAQLMASQDIEEKLLSIEKYYENLEVERILKLQEERTNELKKYGVEVIPEGLGQMSDEVWNNYLTGTIANYEARIEAERKAEADRIKKLKAEADERERIRKVNERLHAKLKIEKERKAVIEAELKAKKDAEAKAETERLEKIESELNKGDVAKVKDLVYDLEVLKTKYSFRSKKNRLMYGDVCQLINKVIDHIKEGKK